MDPFLGQIMMFGGNFAPRGWAKCDGQLLPIAQNSALFSLLGTIYGGDGRTTFALPDLRGRAPINSGIGPGLSNRSLGQRGGQEEVTLNITEIPSHNHTSTNSQQLLSNEAGVRDTPSVGDVIAGASFKKGLGSTKVNIYGAPTGANKIDGGSNTPQITNSGGNRSHNNMPPYLAVTYIIALQGVYPSRN